ncbi:MAG: Cytidylate kinase [candidate division BRC1 bacterium ADurb.BinA364]|nr:MAG: Cytidylate kinase [candidate division BRC1 bacterium ADurb.BinA364]
MRAQAMAANPAPPRTRRLRIVLMDSSAATDASVRRACPPLITIDGPGGVGKSAIAAELARRLGWVSLDTGAIYRTAALEALRQGADLDDGARLAEIAASVAARYCAASGESGTKALLDGEDVSDALRGAAISQATPRVARWPEVREPLIALQRRLAAERPTVAEGRDMGAVVFPAAPLKFYLTASTAERVARRAAQLGDRGSGEPGDLAARIAERDRMDRGRSVGALRAPAGAVVFDTTGRDMENELSLMAAMARAIWWSQNRAIANDA